MSNSFPFEGKETMKRKIVNSLKKEKNILFAYLYGSFARSDETKESDIDIGIFLSNEDHDKFLPEKLMKNIEKALEIEVDIRILNCRDLIFLHQVLKDGELLFSRDEEERIKFETRVYDKYLDFRYYIDQYNKTRRKEILSWLIKN